MKKKIIAQRKIEKARKKEKTKVKKIADKAAKKVYQVSKVINQRRNKKASSSVTSDLQEDLSVIKEDNTQLENTQAFQFDNIENITQLLFVDQLNYDNNNHIITQLAIDLQVILSLDTDNQFFSNHLTHTQKNCHQPKRYGNNWLVN